MAKKKLKKSDPIQLLVKRETFQEKKRPKSDPKSGLGLLSDPGLYNTLPEPFLRCIYSYVREHGYIQVTITYIYHQL